MLVGLAHIHDLNLLHRDVKPENILLFDENGVERAVYADLGCMKSMDEMHNTFTGTSLYMAPEMLVNEPKYDLSVDIWSLGCTLFKLFTSKDLIGKVNSKRTINNMNVDYIKK